MRHRQEAVDVCFQAAPAAKQQEAGAQMNIDLHGLLRACHRFGTPLHLLWIHALLSPRPAGALTGASTDKPALHPDQCYC